MFAGDARNAILQVLLGSMARASWGELELAAKCSRYMIQRTSWVFAARENNFVKAMLRLGRERDQLGVVAVSRGARHQL